MEGRQLRKVYASLLILCNKHNTHMQQTEGQVRGEGHITSVASWLSIESHC